jgi:hypothetical protein
MGMTRTATALLSLAMLFSMACSHSALPRLKPAALPLATTELLSPSPRLIVGQVIAVDRERGFAFVELARDAPVAAAVPDTELLTRNDDLQETARLQVSRHLRGRTLGTTITSGNPVSGDEVVWLAP